MRDDEGAESDMAPSDAPGEGRTLIVLGAGPKGLAIAAKCAALRGLGFGAPRVVLVDRRGAAANWSGIHGYTDGRRLLDLLLHAGIRSNGFSAQRATTERLPRPERARSVAQPILADMQPNASEPRAKLLGMAEEIQVEQRL
jgi:hypothetical protein